MPNKQEENEPKKEVLDLIGGSSKKKRAPQPAPAPAPSRPAPVKKEALDLLSGTKKKAARAAAPAAAEPAAPAPQEETSADDKIINLKPPVSVSELAAMLKAKPFQIIKDLMGMGIFANPNTPLDADAVSTICDIHGYTFARWGKNPKPPSSRARPSSPSWAMWTTAKHPCWTTSAKRAWPRGKPEALPSTSAPIRLTTTAARSPFWIRRAMPSSQKCAPAARTSRTSWFWWWPPMTASCPRHGKPSPTPRRPAKPSSSPSTNATFRPQTPSRPRAA